MIEFVFISITFATFNGYQQSFKSVYEIGRAFRTDHKEYKASLSKISIFNASPAFDELETVPKANADLIKMIVEREKEMFSALFFSHVRIKLLCPHRQEFGVLCSARYFKHNKEFVDVPQKILIRSNRHFELVIHSWKKFECASSKYARHDLCSNEISRFHACTFITMDTT